MERNIFTATHIPKFIILPIVYMHIPILLLTYLWYLTVMYLKKNVYDLHCNYIMLMKNKKFSRVSAVFYLCG